MINQKLQQIGSKLNISKRDISGIQKERIKGKFLYPIIGAVIVICSTVAGFFIGKANPGCINCDGYPFAAAGLIATAGASKKKKFFLVTVIATILLSVIGFVAAYKTGQNMFGLAIMYNVYRRN